MVYLISKWAKENKSKARLILLILHIVLLIDAYLFGQILSDHNVFLPNSTLVIIIAVFLISLFVYPLKNKSGKFIKDSKLFPYSFKRHKITDIVIGLCSFMLILTLSNRISLNDNIKLIFVSESFASEYEDSNVSEKVLTEKNIIPNENKQKGKISYKNMKEKKENFLKKIFKKGNKFNWALLGFILLIVLLGMVASLGISLLACNIYCGSSEVLGWIILINGEALIAFLGVWAIKLFLRKQEKKLLLHKSNKESIEYN